MEAKIYKTSEAFLIATDEKEVLLIAINKEEVPESILKAVKEGRKLQVEDTELAERVPFEVTGSEFPTGLVVSINEEETVDLMINPKCYICGEEELAGFWAILLSPPDEAGKVEKFHVCKECYSRYLKLESLLERL